MRSENDYGVTYIIDGSFLSLLASDNKMGYYMIPSTLKEALPTNLEQFK
jgi:Rad3-related DNA helicase